MGVPLLLTWLRRTFAKCFLSPSAMGSIDNLYIDLNSLLYPAVDAAAQLLLARLASGDAGGEDRWSVTVRDAEDAILSALTQSLEKVCLLVQPHRLIFIAADGVSPMGKMAQQRARRQNSMSRSSARRLCDASGFDMTMLTCGSSFMSRVSHAAHQFVVSYVDRVNAKRHAQNKAKCQRGAGAEEVQPLLVAVVDDASTPGEGEHKLIEAIRCFRANAETYVGSSSHCIVSSDTDVIVSALTLHDPQVYALRVENSGDATAFSLLLFREALYQRLGAPRDPEVFENSLHDIVFLLMLFGNDYLPRITSIADIGVGTLDDLLEFLSKNFVSRGKKLIDPHTSEIHVEAAVYLFEYLEECAGATELKVFVGSSALEKPFDEKKYGPPPSLQSSQGAPQPPLPSLPTAAGVVATGEKVKVAGAELVSSPTQASTHSPLPAATDDDPVVRRCHAYWTMLQWAVQYASGPVPSWNVTYPHTTVPSLADLRRNCRTNQETVVVPGMQNAPVDVLTQLVFLTPTRCALRVLPPSLMADYHATIAKSLEGPMEHVSLVDVANWCDTRRATLTVQEARRFAAFSSGGMRVGVLWSTALVSEELASAVELHRQATLAAANNDTANTSSTIGSDAPKPAYTTSLFSARPMFGGGAKLQVKSFPGLSSRPSTPPPAPPPTSLDDGSTTAAGSAQSPVDVPSSSVTATTTVRNPATPDEAVVVVTAPIEELRSPSFSLSFSDIPVASRELIELSVVDGGTFRCASPFSSNSEQVTLVRGASCGRVMLKFVRVRGYSLGMQRVASEVMRPLPCAVDSDVSVKLATRKREREAAAAAAADESGADGSTMLLWSTSTSADGIAAQEAQRMALQKRRAETLRELEAAKESRRVQLQLETAFKQSAQSR